MHPASSVILFTTSSGAGYALLVLLAIFSALGWLPNDRALGLVGLGSALGLITVGLLSSTFHLGHPERAWRALSQWRSSWLSREGVLAVLTYLPAGLFAIGWVVVGDNGGIWALAGLVAAALALATVYCTGMIYASLKTVPAWHNPLTVPGYLAVALASGGLWFTAIAALLGAARVEYAALTIMLVGLAALIKSRYWNAIENLPPKTDIAAATGLSDIGPVRLLDGPTTPETYIMREMGYKVARRHVMKLRRIAIVAGFGLPALALLIVMVRETPDGASLALSLAAAVAGSIGIIAERWLFFAEAKHISTLYFGTESV